MHLMDAIAELSALSHGVENARDQSHPLLRIYPDLVQRLAGAPRYLLNEAAIHTATELTLGRPKVLLDAMQHLRIPYPKLWVEWPEAGRHRLREVWEREITPDRPLPDRIGFLLECDDLGRKGRVTWVWASLRDDTPNVAPLAAFFDLDGHFPEVESGLLGRLQGNLVGLWKDNPVQLAALTGIWETARHAPEGPWGRYYLKVIEQRHGDMGLANSMADVYGEYIMVWAIMLLLTASRPIVEVRPVDMSRLNKARAKRRQIARLDHSTVTLKLGARAVAEQRRQPLGYTRKSPRVHLVSSYLARRGNHHWVVMPYWRGEGEIISRHVKVRG